MNEEVKHRLLTDDEAGKLTKQHDRVDSLQAASFIAFLGFLAFSVVSLAYAAEEDTLGSCILALVMAACAFIALMVAARFGLTPNENDYLQPLGTDGLQTMAELARKDPQVKELVRTALKSGLTLRKRDLDYAKSVLQQRAVEAAQAEAAAASKLARQAAIQELNEAARL